MFKTIKTMRDIEAFIEETNGLHDGYIVGAEYADNGIARSDKVLFFSPEKTKLIIRVLVTSIYDAVVEIEFENLSEWQIKNAQFEITETSVVFNKQGKIVWTSDNDEFKNGSYVIAGSMRWRFVE